uniref:Uncharacterized protein n=1 Tax=Glossina palpalis gambiensis TaxID=67801 RepID=A0A1B0BM38_9MUSC
MQVLRYVSVTIAIIVAISTADVIRRNSTTIKRAFLYYTICTTIITTTSFITAPATTTVTIIALQGDVLRDSKLLVASCGSSKDICKTNLKKKLKLGIAALFISLCFNYGWSNEHCTDEWLETNGEQVDI